MTPAVRVSADTLSGPVSMPHRLIRVGIVGDVGALMDMLTIAIELEPDLEVSWVTSRDPAPGELGEPWPDVILAWYRAPNAGVFDRLLHHTDCRVMWICSDPRQFTIAPEHWNRWAIVRESDMGSLVQILARLRAGMHDYVEDMGDLSPRQHELLSLIGQGYSNQAIAQIMGIAEKSVENQINLLYQRLGISHDRDINPRVVAASLAIRGRLRRTLESPASFHAMRSWSSSMASHQHVRPAAEASPGSPDWLL